jgi:hypothetical protein
MSTIKQYRVQIQPVTRSPSGSSWGSDSDRYEVVVPAANSARAREMGESMGGGFDRCNAVVLGEIR